MTSSVSRQAARAFLYLAAAVTASTPLLAQPEPEGGPSLDPSSALEPMNDIGIDWPDPTKPDAILEGTSDLVDIPPAETADKSSKTGKAIDHVETNPMTDSQAEQHYSIVLQGLDDIDASEIRTRFDALSTLKQEQKSVANLAQINRRSREDEKLLRELLRAEGYYAASVNARVQSSGGRISVILRVEPGALYHFKDIAITGLERAGEEAERARKAFAVSRDDPVDADKVQAALTSLKSELGDHGFPFAKIDDPIVTVDHADASAVLKLSVDPGSFARFGDIVLSGQRPPFGPKHVRRMARFKPGDVYNFADIDDLRRALIATGLVSTATITPVRTADPNVVNVLVAIERAPPRTIAGELGYGTGEGVRAEVSWTHRNLLRPEGAVTFRGVAGTREQYLGASLRRANLHQRDQVLTAQIAASHVNRDAFDAKSFTLSGGMERQTNIIWQKKWIWSAGGELLVSDERDSVVSTGASRRRTFYIAALPGTLAYDGSDDLLNPTRGFRLAGRLSPELSFHRKTLAYARAQIDASIYQPVGGRTVLAGRVRVGTIAGAQRDEIAPSRRYYAGGGGSVRGYGYQDIGPRDVDNDPIGGRSISEFSLEARVRFGDFGVVPFFDGGNIYTSALPRFTGMRYGAGLGARYYTNFGPIRVDLGTPLNRRKGDARFAVYVSLGQAF